MNLLRLEDVFFSSYLHPWLLVRQHFTLYRDSVIFCKDGKVKIDRLFIGLMFPMLKVLDEQNVSSPVEIILLDWKIRDVEPEVKRLIESQHGNGEYGETSEQVTEVYKDLEETNVEKEYEEMSEQNNDVNEGDKELSDRKVYVKGEDGFDFPPARVGK